MEREEFIQRMNTLQTESEDFLRIYVNKICKSPYDHSSGERVDLRYPGNDFELIKRLFVAFLDNFCPDFVVDESNKKAIIYAMGMASQNVEKPGIVFRGNVGSGKTLLAFLYIAFCQKVFTRNTHCRYYNPVTIMTDFMSKGFEIFNYNLGDILFIDDIGINTDSSHYGNKINVIEHIIYLRYEQFKINPLLQTICTTNLIYKDMINLYGERAISRLNEMVEWNEGILIGDDRRKNKPLKLWPKISHYSDGAVRFTF